MEEEEIDIKQLIKALWRGRIFIILFTSLFAISSVFYSLQIPNKYLSYATLSSAKAESSSLSNFAGSSLGGLASLAGVNLGQEETSDIQIAMEIMKSWGFIEKFIKENKLEVKLSAVNGWNRDTNELIIDNEIYDKANSSWLREKTKYRTSEPTSWELYESFMSILSVSQDEMNNLVIVSIEYYSPSVAREWVNLFVKSINDHMRERKLKQSNANIEYLNEQVLRTTTNETKAMFYNLIEEEVKNKMLAEVSYEFSFITIKEAMVPELKNGPKRFEMVASITLLAGILSFIIVLIMHYSGKRIIFRKD